MAVRHSIAALGLAATALIASPAFAEGGPGLPPLPDSPEAASGPIVGYSVEEREAWLAQCRDRMRGNDDGVGGAIIGGVVGGVAGNRIAGRGHRVAGTVIGAGVGAVAGAAIDRAEDRGEAADFCEDYLARYEASYAGPGPGPDYAYGHPGMHGHPGMYPAPGAGYSYGYPYYSGRVMWVPVKVGCSCGCKPKEHVVEEWVEQPAPPARRVVPDKRIKIQKVQPTKYTKTKYVK